MSLVKIGKAARGVDAESEYLPAGFHIGFFGFRNDMCEAGGVGLHFGCKRCAVHDGLKKSVVRRFCFENEHASISAARTFGILLPIACANQKEEPP